MYMSNTKYKKRQCQKLFQYFVMLLYVYLKISLHKHKHNHILYVYTVEFNSFFFFLVGLNGAHGARRGGFGLRKKKKTPFNNRVGSGSQV